MQGGQQLFAERDRGKLHACVSLALGPTVDCDATAHTYRENEAESQDPKEKGIILCTLAPPPPAHRLGRPGRH
jgi:hypothetical protein